MISGVPVTRATCSCSRADKCEDTSPPDRIPAVPWLGGRPADSRSTELCRECEGPRLSGRLLERLCDDDDGFPGLRSISVPADGLRWCAYMGGATARCWTNSSGDTALSVANDPMAAPGCQATLRRTVSSDAWRVWEDAAWAPGDFRPGPGVDGRRSLLFGALVDNLLLGSTGAA